MGAGWIWDTLADSASSHHIPSLAPAVALPAPRHDRRRTGAAGSPPGGFPFVEFRYAGVECVGARGEPQTRLSFYRRRLKILSCVRPRESGDPALAWIPAFAGMNGALCATEQIYTRPAGFAGQWELTLLQDAALAGPTAAGISGA
jgi:hypothetical protein